MRAYERNPRQITSKRFARLQETLARLGDLSGIVLDLNTNQVVGGHQRLRAMFGEEAGEFKIEGSDIEPTEQYPYPDKQGTVTHGFILWRGFRYAYREVRYTDEQMAEANIAANLGAGAWDFDGLANNFDTVDLKAWGFDNDLFNEWQNDIFNLGQMLGSENGGGSEDGNYSRKIEPPTYQVTGEKPSIDDLFDKSKTVQLIEAIDKVEGIPDEEREFLKIAAQRHTVLNFHNIAEYYAHSSEAMQALMEDSALVIIDFNKAIELGFVELTKEIAEMVRDEYGDD